MLAQKIHLSMPHSTIIAALVAILLVLSITGIGTAQFFGFSNPFSPQSYQSPYQSLYQSPYQSMYQSPYQSLYQSPYQSMYQSPYQSMYQSSYQSMYQSPYQSMYQSPYQSMYQSPYQSMYQSPYQSPYQSMYQSPYQSMYQSPYQSLYQSPYQSPYQSMYQNPYQNPYQSPWQNPWQQQLQYLDADVDLDSDDDETSITVDVGDTISIVLQSNVTTGYQWVLDTSELDPNVVSKKSNQYFPGNTSSVIVGAGGYEQWIFEAEGADTTTIKLNYKRTWETTVQDTFEVTVTVE